MGTIAGLIGALVLSLPSPADVSRTKSAPTVPEMGADGGPEGETQFGLPETLRDDDADEATSASDESQEDIAEHLPEQYLSRATPWIAPDYSRQEGAIGWEPTTFKVPSALAKRVAFWKEICSKYSTNEGVLHDIDLALPVFEAIDFSNVGKSQRARSRFVRARKAAISDRFNRLSRIKKESELRDAEDHRYFRMAWAGSYADLFQNKSQLKKVQSKFREFGQRRRIRFQLGQRDRFILGIYYSGRYLRDMERVFRNERLPIELTRLPFVESSFNIQARSRVGASGIWQFMPRTARSSMMVNRDVDERNDPLTATAAAARLLKSNFEQLRTWPLALTAYNHGARGVARAVKKVGSRDLAVIIDRYSSRRFGFASSNFYACFLAALEVEKNAAMIFHEPKWSLALEGAEVDLHIGKEWRSIVDFYDGESDLAALQNPHFNNKVRTGRRPAPRGTFVRVPIARREIAENWAKGRIKESDLKAQLRLVPLPKQIIQVESGVSGRIGAIAEATQALFPFFKGKKEKAASSEKAAQSDAVTHEPSGPDGGPGLPEAQ